MLQTDILEALPVAVYTTDAEGRITFFNEAAVELWGHRPELGSLWCGSWRLFWPDGRPLPHDECPMAVALKEGRPVRGVEAVAERPDGTRVPFIPYPTPLRDSSGRLTGAVNTLIDLTDQDGREFESARLAAIVASSDDAIISKTLDGRITSWNAGATHIFGYEASEAIGKPITCIIPPELLDEEKEILAKLKHGGRIDHYDTIRIAKDGRRIDISLTVSPLRDRLGNIVGASKVARDVSERKRSENLQSLMFEELNHRVKNTLAMVQAIASQSLRGASKPAEFVESFSGRLRALAGAHNLLSRGEMKGADVAEILREQVLLGSTDGARVSFSGPPEMLDARLAVQLALVLHELATNARKYGALAVPTGRLTVTWKVEPHAGRSLLLIWRESGVPMARTSIAPGFGTVLIERTIEAHGGEVSIRYGADGVVCEISLPIAASTARVVDWAPPEAGLVQQAREKLQSNLHGKRILIVEDDPLIAMEIEACLRSAGCEVIGPAGTIDSARRAIAQGLCEAALLDANLGGHPVDELAAALTKLGKPFAFSTGYGREALPLGYREAPVLAKPFGPDRLLEMVTALIADRSRPPDVLSFR